MPFAEEEHKLNMKILQVQELNERERLKQEMEKSQQEMEKSQQEMLKTKQEKINLEILELQLQKIKRIDFYQKKLFYCYFTITVEVY